MRVPARQTQISCCRGVPENAPTTAAVMAVGGWSVRLRSCIVVLQGSWWVVGVQMV